MTAPQHHATAGPAALASAKNLGAAQSRPPDRDARLMARRATGSIRTRENRDGTVSHELRFSAYGEREVLTLRDVPRTVAERELELILAKAKAGVWRREDHEVAELAPPPEVPTFHVLASEVLAARKADLAPRAYDDYLWLLRRHLLPFFHAYRVDAITRQLVWSWRAEKIKERDELDALRAKGAVVRDRRGNPRRGLGPRKLNQAIRLLAAILDDAIDRDLIDTNPARDRKLRRKVPKPLRSFLELDELAALLDAARELEREGRVDLRVHEMRALRARGGKLSEIAKRFGVSASTVSHWCRDEGRVAPARRLHWSALLTALGYGGLRISELCDLRWREVHLHAARLWVADSKTETGRREVDLSPALVEALIGHRQTLLERGLPCGPADFVFASERATRLSDDNVRARILRPAVERANRRRVAAGLPPLPDRLTPHSLRRTYISIALLASAGDVGWVMAQVGHADAETTMRIYSQLLKRRKRAAFGRRFDSLVAEAKQALGAGHDAAWSAPVRALEEV
jgi:integrase